MKTSQMPLLDLKACDVMKGPVETIPEQMPLREAAVQLRRLQVTGAPVVDARGRCVGVLSAVDFLHQAGGTEGLPPRGGGIRTCIYQEDRPSASGKETIACTLPPGSCVLQAARPTSGGASEQICLLPRCMILDWQQVHEDSPEMLARDCMTRDVVTATSQTPLTRLARMMVDAHIHRIIVVADDGRPVGIVTSTDLLAAVASIDADSA